ncbi:MAG: hypothetical protein EOO04_34190, partial [Chitinophagaceae bacterium]
MYRNFFKRLFDLLVSLVGICLLSPVFIAVVIFLSIANQGKPFFFQRRPGKNKKIFLLVKFKLSFDDSLFHFEIFEKSKTF